MTTSYSNAPFKFVFYYTLDSQVSLTSKKSQEKYKNKLRTLHPKNHKNFKNSKPRLQFYWFL